MNDKTKTFNANIAGMIDAAAFVIEGVENLLQEGSQVVDNNGIKKIEVPPAYYEELQASRDTLEQISNWLINKD
jgi:hypothetical protein|tara:strand:- start:975 stop:1196 length:222 start_codon:yes stop_codon:yes gene_type:complete